MTDVIFSFAYNYKRFFEKEEKRVQYLCYKWTSYKIDGSINIADQIT